MMMYHITPSKCSFFSLSRHIDKFVNVAYVYNKTTEATLFELEPLKPKLIVFLTALTMNLDAKLKPFTSIVIKNLVL